MTQIHTHAPDDHESAYDGLLANDAHWAFGTSFEDPLAGVDTTVPDGVAAHDLATYCLMLGDDALVLSQRLTEWCSNAPDLEEDIAVANIALDLLGQARLLLARAATADVSVVPVLPAGSPVPPEDALAFFRGDQQFRNVRMAELPNGDFAEVVCRVLLMSTARLAVFERLAQSRDAVLAAVAAKGMKELTYHRDYAARWFVMLARGTQESHRRLVAALSGLLGVWGELFETHSVERRVADAGIGVDPADVASVSQVVLDQVLAAGGVEPPVARPLAGVGGKKGRSGLHTEALSLLLAEMQSVAREHPLGVW
jgi:ring-1,2-phenylacetyl-CoA epoxidase subunit PaaC